MRCSGTSGSIGSVSDSFEDEFVVNLHRRGAMTASAFGAVPDAAD